MYRRLDADGRLPGMSEPWQRCELNCRKPANLIFVDSGKDHAQ